MTSDHVFIIAEAGVNHNGLVALAEKMVEIAAAAGADAVKFQTFRAESLVTRKAEKADYQKKTSGPGESQFDMLKRLELSHKAHLTLIDACKSKGIEFLSSPFDLESIDMLKNLGIGKWKIPSGEITNLPFLRKIAGFSQEIIMSTGMADLGEITDALSVLTFHGTPREKITLLHCNTEYPTPFEDVNLRAMQTLKSSFPGVRVGYSDHTPGLEIPVAAVAMGALVIEKHFTLDRAMIGPDHEASLTPDELAQMVRSIRNVETALGSGLKEPSPSERKNRVVARKSIVAARDIRVGEVFTSDNLTTKRPGNEMSPMRWDEVVGKKSERNFKKDEPIILSLSGA